MSEQPELWSHPVTYEVDDLVALSKLVPRGPLQVFRLAAGVLVILLLFTTVGEAWALTGWVDWPALFACVFVAGILFLLTNRRVRAGLWLRIMRLGALHAAHSYAITPAALRISSSKGVFDARWTAFTEIKRAGDRLFAFMNHRQAYVVPRRAFDSDEQFNAFANAAQERWEQSQRF